MSEFSYTVTGMTCEHCARSVTEEISEISGVQRVDVDVPSGRVTVTSEVPLPADDIRAAVAAAGYEVVS